MKIVRVKLVGELTPEDRIMLHAIHPRGGRTTAGTTVETPRAELDSDGNPVKVVDTAEKILDRLRLSAERTFLSDCFKFSAKDGVLRIECGDDVHDLHFVDEVYGAKTERLEIEEF